MPDRYLGQSIGKYRVIRLLGTGAFAWVYEAIDRDLEIPVALKILRPEFAGNADAESRFRREATTAARLRHPNIVTVRDVGAVDDAVYVAMDLHPLSLARRLALVSRLPEPEVVRIGLDVSAALAIAHAGGIIHRDIKPDNILIGPAGEAIVADFGLARALDRDLGVSASNQVMGTPHYFSPEQARGLEIDGRSDLYSLGVTLYRTVTGRLPFEGDDWYGVARQHVEDAPPPATAYAPEVTPAFEAILTRLLAKRPEDRYENALQVADALALLPTAPITRGTSLTLHTASQTAVDLTPIMAPRAAIARPRSRSAGVAVLGIGLLGAAAFGAQRAGVMARFGMGAPSSTIGAPGDSARDTTNSDSLRSIDAARDSARLDSLLASADPIIGAGGITAGVAPSAGANSRAPRAPRVPPLAALDVSVTDTSAAILINGVRAGEGSFSGEVEANARLTVRAILPQSGCPSAERDTTINLRPRQRSAVKLTVRYCRDVTFNVTPVEAKVSLNPIDGGPVLEIPANRGQPIRLPTGTYLVSAFAPRCYDYANDTFALASDTTKRIRMECRR